MMELEDMLLVLKNGDQAALADASVECVHVVSARRILRYSDDFNVLIRRSKIDPLILNQVLVAEGIVDRTRRATCPAYDSRHMLDKHDVLYLLFLALAHRSWATLETVMVAFKACRLRIEHFKNAYAMMSRGAVRGERLCTFCAPITGNGDMLTGQKARMKDNVISTLATKGMHIQDTLIALNTDGNPGHTEITRNTIFSDIVHRRRADIRVYTKRKRAEPSA